MIARARRWARSWAPLFADTMTSTWSEHKNFLAHAKVRNLTLADVANMSEEDCYWHCVEIRFGDRQSMACPSCGVIDTHYYRASRRQWRCRHCDMTFSCTTGTAFQDRKLPFKKLLLGVVYFVSGAKGVASLQVSRLLDVQVKTAFVMVGKLREALARSADIRPLSGTVELDGGHFGGRPRSGRVRRKATKTEIAASVSARLYQQNIGGPRPKTPRSRANIRRLKNRRIVFVLRQHGGVPGKGAVRTMIDILPAESAEHVTPVIEGNVVRGSRIMTDENAAYSRLSANYTHETVNHQIEYSTVDGVNENQAESFFSRLRRYVIGISHKCEPKYLADIAWEMAWREDMRRKTEQEKSTAVLRATSANGRSIKWRGYWQRHQCAGPTSA